MEGMGQGKLHIFLFEGCRTSEEALLIFLPIAQLLFSQVLRSSDHQQNEQIKPDFKSPIDRR